MPASLAEMGLCSMKVFHGVRPNEFEITGGMVPFLTGPKGAGKTSLLGHIAGLYMLPPRSGERVRYARKEAEILRMNGYEKAQIPANVKHLVYSDIPIKTCKDQGYLPRHSWKLDVDRMLIPNGANNAQFFPHGALIIIDELMEKFDARDFNRKDAGMPPEMRKFLQICRHRGIAVVTGCLLASGADKRFRQMSQNILLIVHRDETYKKDKLVKTTWYCLEFASAELCDKFLNNRHEFVQYTPRVFEHVGDIHQCVDSYAENDEFLYGMENHAIEFPEQGAI